MRTRLMPIAVAMLVVLGGVVLSTWGVRGEGSLGEVRQAITDVRDLLRDFQTAVNDAQRFARQPQQELETVLSTLQQRRGQLSLDNLNDRISDTDRTLIDLDSAESEFVNLVEVKNQIESLGDLAVKVVDLANQGIISNAQSNAILRSLDQIATQLDRIDDDISEVDHRLSDARRELDRAIGDLEDVVDNADFVNSTGTTTVDAADLIDPTISLQRAINDLKAVDRRAQRLRDRIREIDRRLTRVNSDLRPRPRSGRTSLGKLNPVTPQTVAIFNLAGQQMPYSALSSDFVKAVRLGLAAHGVYFVVQRVQTEHGTRYKLNKLVAGH